MEKGFDAKAFYAALAATVESRGITWKQAAAETGVSATTLTRMAQGRKPDASSLAVLSTWAGIDLAQFVTLSIRPVRAEPLAIATAHFRSDPNLSDDSKDALEAILRTAYAQLRNKS